MKNLILWTAIIVGIAVLTTGCTITFSATPEDFSAVFRKPAPTGFAK